MTGGYVDDKHMTQISTLAQVDPVFREVISKLYPAADPRELWDLAKSMPDQSAVHVNGGEKKKKALAGGLLFGATAEGAATYTAGRSAFKAKTPMIHPGQGELFKPARSLGGTLKTLKDGHGGKAGFALQAANLGVGLGAARELFKKPPKQTIPKRLSDEEAKHLFDPIIQARKEGVITTPKALEMIEAVEKGLIFDLKATKTALRFPHGGTALKLQPAAVEAKGQELHEQTNRAIHAGRFTVGGTAAVAVGGYGYHRGKKAANKVQTPIKPPQSSVKKNEVDYEFTGEISKLDSDKQQVFGWCSLSTVDGRPVVDLQNDYITIEEIEKSAYEYVKTSRKGGDMHARIGDDPVHTSDMIESVIITPEKLAKMGIPEEAISKVNTGWWVGYQINDADQWAKVKSGERTGFSIHGKGQRLEKVLGD